MPKIAQIFINLLKVIDKFARYTLIFLIRGFRPFLGPAHCKYPISCTNYAQEQLETRYFFPAIFLIIKRVICCNPFTKPR